MMTTTPSVLPKVVQITFDANERNGGVFTASQHFAEALRSWSQPTIINFTSERRDSTAETIFIPISPNIMGKTYGWVDRRQQVRMVSALHGADFVIIHVPFRFHAEFVAKWCARNRVPYAFVPHGALDPYAFTYRAWQKRVWLSAIGRQLIARAVFVIFATRGEETKARRCVKIDRSRIFPWPTPVPILRDREKARNAVSNRLHLPPGMKILLYLGRLHPMKRPIETAQAFRKVAPKGWILVMAGPEDGIHQADIGPDERVIVAGGIYGPEKEELLAAADALVLYSHRENFGFSVVEALAHGTSVLISRELDLAPEIETEGCGWILDGGSEAGRVDGIRQVTSCSAEELARRGDRGRRWVAEHLTRQKFAAELKREVLGAMKAPEDALAG